MYVDTKVLVATDGCIHDYFVHALYLGYLVRMSPLTLYSSSMFFSMHSTLISVFYGVRAHLQCVFHSKVP